MDFTRLLRKKLPEFFNNRIQKGSLTIVKLPNNYYLILIRLF